MCVCFHDECHENTYDHENTHASFATVFHGMHAVAINTKHANTTASSSLPDERTTKAALLAKAAAQPVLSTMELTIQEEEEGLRLQEHQQHQEDQEEEFLRLQELLQQE
jgi:hypothetical protein